jgi:hypothetical protein
MLWITDWPFAEPYQTALVSAIRRGHNENDALILKPGHILEDIEWDELVGFFAILVCFRWDALFMPCDGSYAIKTTNDECLSITVYDDIRVANDILLLVRNHGLANTVAALSPNAIGGEPQGAKDEKRE